MLDAPDYPKSYIELENIKINFFNVLKKNNKLLANVEIFKKR